MWEIYLGLGGAFGLEIYIDFVNHGGPNRLCTKGIARWKTSVRTCTSGGSSLNMYFHRPENLNYVPLTWFPATFTLALMGAKEGTEQKKGRQYMRISIHLLVCSPEWNFFSSCEHPYILTWHDFALTIFVHELRFSTVQHLMEQQKSFRCFKA